MSERDLEAPEADTIEQDALVSADDADDDSDLGDTDFVDEDVPIEVDPADRAEQQRSAGPADDDYR
jgi:hypothetical protein